MTIILMFTFWKLLQSPGACFIKAGKRAAIDNLHGSLDALAWGKTPSIGSGGLFDILYSGEVHVNHFHNEMAC